MYTRLEFTDINIDNLLKRKLKNEMCNIRSPLPIIYNL